MLNQKERKRLRAIGHHLAPVVTIGDKGLNDNVLAELTRAITDHELIKIRLSAGDREERRVLLQEITTSLKTEVIQSIGKVALIYKKADSPDPALSNILRAIQDSAVSSR